MGIASSMGIGTGESLEAFRAKRSGIGPIRILDTIHKGGFMSGEIYLTNMELMELLGIPPGEAGNYTRTALIGMIAAREAYRCAGLTPEDEIPTALVSATTVGGMDRTEKEFRTGEIPPGFVNTHPCGDSTDRMAQFLGLSGYRTTISTACSSGANAIIHGARLIKHGLAGRAIVGGVDALSKFTLNGFNSLMILDKEHCRPFDRDRRGLNLGEGAGYLVLESEEVATAGRDRIICRLSGYANANDAYHQTASSPDGEGAFLAMTGALAMGGINSGEVDYINVHGTGTENNDASEGAALIRLFGEKPPPFSSTKSFTGHTLGAAAGIEAVFSVMAIRQGLLLPALNFQNPIEELGLIPGTTLKEGESISHVLSNSFGFGGNNSSLVFSKQ